MSQAETITPASTNAGQLCIWTDTESHSEADFNAWYNREHMQERVAIPGFRFARRFLANDGGARRYLALYVTASLDVFHSDAYRQAFTVQTDWSMRNFARMSNTQRRVSEQRFEAGAGEGGHAAIFVAPPQAMQTVDSAHWREAAHAAALTPGVHAVRVFVTDASLSSPLATPGATASAARQDALVIVEGSSSDAAREAASKLATLADIEPDADTIRSFDMLWRLSA
ncbi:DUF4286 family protein [Paraburkholderia bannensis]|uniref:DUF4286 family protein n=1 Tax=Paraburkholderia bannensis TaxID=765414 RepID=UPI002AB611E2|nr:DUF4286 family protein [Paraburkholderia bannensis]